MGGRAATCTLDILDHTSQINGRDTLLNEVWSQGCYSSKNWIPNTENKLF